VTSDQLRLWHEVIERDGGTCIQCGMAGSEVHHIISRGRKGAWCVENMCVVCPECHRRAHNRRSRGILIAEMKRRHGYDYSAPMYRGLSE
jgi:5-methylcytosine-specific restriction endonuclease McrA